jgi:hypothetical protein
MSLRPTAGPSEVPKARATVQGRPEEGLVTVQGRPLHSYSSTGLFWIGDDCTFNIRQITESTYTVCVYDGKVYQHCTWDGSLLCDDDQMQYILTRRIDKENGVVIHASINNKRLSTDTFMRTPEMHSIRIWANGTWAHETAYLDLYHPYVVFARNKCDTMFGCLTKYMHAIFGLHDPRHIFECIHNDIALITSVVKYWYGMRVVVFACGNADNILAVCDLGIIAHMPTLGFIADNIIQILYARSESEIGCAMVNISDGTQSGLPWTVASPH